MCHAEIRSSFEPQEPTSGVDSVWTGLQTVLFESVQNLSPRRTNLLTGMSPDFW